MAHIPSFPTTGQYTGASGQMGTAKDFESLNRVTLTLIILGTLWTGNRILGCTSPRYKITAQLHQCIMYVHVGTSESAGAWDFKHLLVAWQRRCSTPEAALRVPAKPAAHKRSLCRVIGGIMRKKQENEMERTYKL